MGWRSSDADSRRILLIIEGREEWADRLAGRGTIGMPERAKLLTAKRRPIRENRLRIFVLECPDPIDALQGRSEGPVVAAIGKLIGHEVLTFLVRSKRELRETCRYLGSIEPQQDVHRQPDRPLCLHISAHGNSSGLGIGADFLKWSELAKAIKAFLSIHMQYTGKRIVVLSACRAECQKLTETIRKQAAARKGGISPPKYLFCTSGEVLWQNAAVGWTLFYHLLPEADLDIRKSVMSVLDKIEAAGVGSFIYFRWDDEQEKYLRYEPTRSSAHAKGR